jgi:NAD(P)-dependent dehydrogenase (short-subunit alcohol dehydrogenase family)
MSTALITGAGGELGRATARRLAADGFTVVATDIDERSLAETAELIPGCHQQLIDLRDGAAIESLFAEVAASHGPVEVLVNNAAIYPARPFLDVQLSEYDAVQAVNQRGYWIAAQCAARQMVAVGRGAIINIASITMHGGWPDLAAYVTTKGAATGLTRALARELGPYGVRVNAVSPGAFPTAAEEIHPDPEKYQAFVLDHQALKRRGTAAELAAVVSFLAGPDSSFVTGQTIEVNGGWVMT